MSTTKTNNTQKRVPKSQVKFKLSLNDEQKATKASILEHPFNFINGVTGTGKTILSCQVALDNFFKRKVNRIIITRPTVGTEDNGFLPGTLEEKMEPWIVPIKSNLMKLTGAEKVRSLFEKDIIELISLSHFRGQTFDSAVCIIDEYQNLTKSQLKMCLGRLGKDSIMIFCGDIDQIDLKNSKDSAVHLLSKLQDSKYVHISYLLDNHRHPAVSEVLTLLRD